MSSEWLWCHLIIKEGADVFYRSEHLAGHLLLPTNETNTKFHEEVWCLRHTCPSLMSKKKQQQVSITLAWMSTTAGYCISHGNNWDHGNPSMTGCQRVQPPTLSWSWIHSWRNTASWHQHAGVENWNLFPFLQKTGFENFVWAAVLYGTHKPCVAMPCLANNFLKPILVQPHGEKLSETCTHASIALKVLFFCFYFPEYSTNCTELATRSRGYFLPTNHHPLLPERQSILQWVQPPSTARGRVRQRSPVHGFGGPRSPDISSAAPVTSPAVAASADAWWPTGRASRQTMTRN
jgi:hypothetical protein